MAISGFTLFWYGMIVLSCHLFVCFCSLPLFPPLSFFPSSDYFVCELALRCNDVPWASQIMEEIVEVSHRFWRKWQITQQERVLNLRKVRLWTRLFPSFRRFLRFFYTKRISERIVGQIVGCARSSSSPHFEACNAFLPHFRSV